MEEALLAKKVEMFVTRHTAMDGTRKKEIEARLHQIKAAFDGMKAHESAFTAEDALLADLPLDDDFSLAENSKQPPIPPSSSPQTKKFKICAPTKVAVVGSFLLAKQQLTDGELNVDLVAFAPPSLLNAEVHTPAAYWRRRTAFLAALRNVLLEAFSGDGVRVSWATCVSSAVAYRRMLEVRFETPAECTFRIQVGVAETSEGLYGAMAPTQRTVPNKILEGMARFPSNPKYATAARSNAVHNAALLADASHAKALGALHAVAEKTPHFGEAVCLLKAWHRGCIDRHTNGRLSLRPFALVQVAATMARIGVFAASTTAWAIFEAVLGALADAETLLLAAAAATERNSPHETTLFGRQMAHLFKGRTAEEAQSFLEAFAGGPLLLDAAGRFNVFHAVDAANVRLVASAAIRTLHRLQTASSSFEAVFGEDVFQCAPFDAVLSVDFGMGDAAAAASGFKTRRFASFFASAVDWRWAVGRWTAWLLAEALRDRLSNAVCWFEPSESSMVRLCVGFEWRSPRSAASCIVLGPSSEAEAEAAAFRVVWGAASQLQRQADGSICEVVRFPIDEPCAAEIDAAFYRGSFVADAAAAAVLENTSSAAKRPMHPLQFFAGVLLQTHAALPPSSLRLGEMLPCALFGGNRSLWNAAQSKRESAAAATWRAAFEALKSCVTAGVRAGDRQLAGVSQIHAVGDALRGTAASFPLFVACGDDDDEEALLWAAASSSLQGTEVLLGVDGSVRWPQDETLHAALQTTLLHRFAAFLASLSCGSASEAAGLWRVRLCAGNPQPFLLVGEAASGCVFRLQIAASASAFAAIDASRFAALLASKCASWVSCVRCTKRWLKTQLLFDAASSSLSWRIDGIVARAFCEVAAPEARSPAHLAAYVVANFARLAADASSVWPETWPSTSLLADVQVPIAALTSVSNASAAKLTLLLQRAAFIANRFAAGTLNCAHRFIGDFDACADLHFDAFVCDKTPVSRSLQSAAFYRLCIAELRKRLHSKGGCIVFDDASSHPTTVAIKEACLKLFYDVLDRVLKKRYV